MGRRIAVLCGSCMVLILTISAALVVSATSSIPEARLGADIVLALASAGCALVVACMYDEARRP